MWLFATRAAKLTWSRALVKLLVEELYPDDLFTALIGRLDRVPPRQWPRVIAIALALRHSWRRDGLARVARRLHVSLSTTINVYTQVLDASLRTAVDRIGGELFTIVHETETGSELSR